MTHRYRISSRIRFTLFVVLVILLITTCANFALGLNTANSATYIEYTQVEVMSGDTLWSIAETYMDDDSDIRRSVYELCKINDITASQLQAGMTLLVPVN
ncbi:MAG: LysM peptidoglycan-binding domain-containing protein [Lachnospiraceae bacterium]|nr:LysM peptidoglycan-binding domain-containing protein [Lachnospiraceae bacterium]